MFGMSVTLGGQGWGVCDFDGTWSRTPDQHCQWTVEDQTKLWGEMCRRVADLMAKAKVNTCADMVGIPVEVSFKRYARITPYIGQFMMTNVHVRWNKIETEDDLF